MALPFIRLAAAVCSAVIQEPELRWVQSNLIFFTVIANRNKMNILLKLLIIIIKYYKLIDFIGENANINANLKTKELIHQDFCERQPQLLRSGCGTKSRLVMRNMKFITSSSSPGWMQIRFWRQKRDCCTAAAAAATFSWYFCRDSRSLLGVLSTLTLSLGACPSRQQLTYRPLSSGFSELAGRKITVICIRLMTAAR